MTLPLHPSVVGAPLLSPRAVQALDAWLATHPKVPDANIPIIGIMRSVYVHCPYEKDFIEEAVITPAKDCSAVSEWIMPVFEDLINPNLGGTHELADIKEDDLLDNKMKGYAQIALEMEYGFNSQALELDMGNAHFFAQTMGIAHTILHTRDVSIMIPGGDFFTSHMKPAQDLTDIERDALVRVFVHYGAESSHARVSRAARLNKYLDKTIQDMWASNFGVYMPSSPFDVQSVNVAALDV